MIVSSRPLGIVGLLPDQPDHALPVGAWKNGRNLRFNDQYVERIAEPELILATADPGKWLQVYEDSNGPRAVYASDTKLYRLNLTGDAWEDVTNTTHGSYTSGGKWQSFQWGTAVVFNNGIEPPQILLPTGSEFTDLANWGLLTSGQKTVTCQSIRPVGDFMVAINVTIDGDEKLNGVWSSGPGVQDNDDSNFFQPSWDYEDPGSSSKFNLIGTSDGPLVDLLELGNNAAVLYTDSSCHIFQLIGGSNVWSNRRLFDYGLIGIGAVVAYKNFHFCVGTSNIWQHDGSRVVHVADARIERQFFSDLADFDDITGTENLEFKELHFLYNAKSGKREYLVYNYKDDNYTLGDASVEGSKCAAMAYDLQIASSNVETYDSIQTTYEGETRRYIDFVADSDKRAMFWLTDDGLYKAETLTLQDSQKEYFIERATVDFSELDPSITTNRWKELLGVYPHIRGAAETRFTFSWGENLGAIAGPAAEVLDYDPSTDYKIDPRVGGRYIGVKIELLTGGDWRLSTMDYDLLVTHGR